MGKQPYSGSHPRARYIRSAIATALLLLLLALFVSAGMWQLDRAGQKHDLNAAFDAGSVVDVVRRPVNEKDAAEFRFRRFKLAGQYDPEHQILLDNIVAGGQNGYQVLTPFISDGQTILVNRGWLPASPDRRIIPDISVDDQSRTIFARLNRLPVPGIRLEGEQQASGWPRRLLFPVKADIETALGTEVPDYQLLLDADQPDGYLREWKAVDVGPEKHYGYAFQWFAFALISLFFYVLLNFRWNKQHKQSLHSDNSND